jgi:MFS transporter, SP family, solute carrier family 2 (facilitated glucose transporter), member 3
VLKQQVSNKLGRCEAIKVNMWLFLCGGLLLSFAPTIMWLIPARLLIGFASGYASVIVPIYLGELAPPTLRGTLGTLTQVCVTRQFVVYLFNCLNFSYVVCNCIVCVQ